MFTFVTRRWLHKRLKLVKCDDSRTNSDLAARRETSDFSTTSCSIQQTKDSDFFSLVFQHLHYHATAKQNKTYIIVWPSEKISKDSFQLPQNMSPNTSDSLPRLCYVMCAYACVHRLRSSRKRSQTESLLTLSLWSGDESVFVMSGVKQAATGQVDELWRCPSSRLKESVRRTLSNQRARKNNLAIMYSKPTKLKDVLQPFLSGCHGYIIKVVLECWKWVCFSYLQCQRGPAGLLTGGLCLWATDSSLHIQGWELNLVRRFHPDSPEEGLILKVSLKTFFNYHLTSVMDTHHALNSSQDFQTHEFWPNLAISFPFRTHQVIGIVKKLFFDTGSFFFLSLGLSQQIGNLLLIWVVGPKREKSLRCCGQKPAAACLPCPQERKQHFLRHHCQDRL